MMTKKRLEDFDITASVGDSFHRDPPEWPMYSFSRPARLLWNAIGKRLAEDGWTEMQIKEWLQSRETRWALDFDLGDQIEELGRRYAEGHVLSSKEATP